MTDKYYKFVIAIWVVGTIIQILIYSFKAYYHLRPEGFYMFLGVGMVILNFCFWLYEMEDTTVF